MNELETLLQQLENQAVRCHASADAPTRERYATDGFPMEPELENDLKKLHDLCQQAGARPEIDFLQSPRGFYLSAYPLIGLALLQVFGPTGPAGQIDERLRRSHFARRLYRLPDHLHQRPEAGGSDWSTMSALLDQQIDRLIAATFDAQKAPHLAQFFQNNPQEFDLLYHNGQDDFVQNGPS